MVDEFETHATPEERATLEEWYTIGETFNKQDKPHIVSVSLFWKNVRDTDPDLPEPTLERMRDAVKLGLAKRFDPWPHYVQPLLDGTPLLKKTHPDVVVRVYLAKDLEFLIPDLVDAGCEVCWMRHSSIRFAPGGLWRLLAFGDEGKLVTMADTDRMKDIPADIGRTRSMKEVGLGVWRVPFPLAEAPDGSVHYRPFVGSQLGLVGGWPMQQLLQAFTWHSLRGTIPRTMDFPGCGERPVNWGVWPNHYFDEWFLAVALYPRFASAGMVTFAPSNLRCTVMLLLDIEYAMWANPNSQMVFVPHENCCPPPADSGNAGHAGEPETAEASENEHRVKLPS